MADPKLMGDIEVLKRGTAAIKDIQKWTLEFAKSNKQASEQTAKLLGLEKLKGDEYKKVRESLKEATKNFKEYAKATADVEKGIQAAHQLNEAQKKLAETQRQMAAEARREKLAGTTLGRAAGALGMPHGGLREGAKSMARNALGAVGIQSFNPWVLAAQAAMKVAQKAAEATRHSLDLLIASGGRLTGEKVLGQASSIAAAFAKNEFVAIKWGAALEDVNKATLHFSERAGMSVEGSQKFTERLARSSRMMGVDFSDAVDFASEQMTQLGKSTDETLKVLEQAHKVSRLTAMETGHMGEKAGKTGGFFAKDLLKAVREVSKETGMFKNQNELLVNVLGNVYSGAVKLGAGYGLAAGATKAFGKMLGGMSEWGQYVAGSPIRRQFTANIKQWEKELAQLEKKAKRGRGLSEEESKRRGELLESIGTARLAGGASVEGPAFALKAALEGVGGEAFSKTALKSAVATIYKGEGLGKEGFLGAAKAQGLSARETRVLYDLMGDIVKGNKNLEQLTDDERKKLDKIANITGQAESQEQKLVGTIAKSTDVMGTLMATLNNLAGKIASLVLEIGKLALYLGKKFGFIKDEPEKKKDYTVPSAPSRTTAEVSAAIDAKAKEKEKKERERAKREGREYKPPPKGVIAKLKEEEEAQKKRDEALKKSLQQTDEPEDEGTPAWLRRRSGGKKGEPEKGKPKKKPKGARAEVTVGDVGDEDIVTSSPGVKVIPPAGRGGAFLTPGAKTAALSAPKIAPPSPEEKEPKTAAASAGARTPGAATASTGGLRITGTVSPADGGRLKLDGHLEGAQDALAKFEAERAANVGPRVRST